MIAIGVSNLQIPSSAEVVDTTDEHGAQTLAKKRVAPPA